MFVIIVQQSLQLPEHKEALFRGPSLEEVQNFLTTFGEIKEVEQHRLSLKSISALNS